MDKGAPGNITMAEVEDREKSRAYHAVTRGWIENELCMRVDPAGRTLGELLRDWLAGPLGLEGELTLGPETTEHAHNIAPLVTISPAWLFGQAVRIWDRRVSLKSLVVATLLLNVCHSLLLIRPLPPVYSNWHVDFSCLSLVEHFDWSEFFSSIFRGRRRGRGCAAPASCRPIQSA